MPFEHSLSSAWFSSVALCQFLHRGLGNPAYLQYSRPDICRARHALRCCALLLWIRAGCGCWQWLLPVHDLLAGNSANGLTAGRGQARACS
jgi:hypothetical protein